MANNTVFVSDILPSDANLTFIGRIIRLWSVADINNGNRPFSMELVLMDSRGDRISAVIKKTLIYRFERELKEGNVYRFSKFGVSTNVGAYRATNHKYKLNFLYNTVVSRDNSNVVPQMIHKFINPQSIFATGFDTDYLVDFIGIITAVGTEREYEKDGVRSKLNIIELNNDGYKFKVTLFGQFVDELNSFIASGNVDNVVVGVLFAKAKIFGGRVVLQNSVYASRVIFGLESSEAVDLRNRMIDHNPSPQQGLTQINDNGRVSIADEFLMLTPRSTIDALKGYMETTTFVVLGTIDSVVAENSWWYNSCNVCQRKVYLDSDLYYCEHCVRHAVLQTPRFRINLRVIDETETAIFTLFDRDATMLLGRTCADLLESINQAIVNEPVPNELDALIGRTMLFKVDVSPPRSMRFDRTFTIKKICDKEDIIDRFKGQQALEAGGNAEGVDSDAHPTDTVARDLLDNFAATMDDGGKDCAEDKHNISDCVVLKRPFEEGSISSVKQTGKKVPKVVVKIEKE